MTVKAAIRAVAGSNKTMAAKAFAAWNESADQIAAQGIDNDQRRAMLIGQCAHESAQFKSTFENLNYSADALKSTFKKHFRDEAEFAAFARNPKMIANRVYSSRMGNGDEASGEGFLYRGRGYLQLTGKSNYIKYGQALGIDLVGNPDLAADPAVSWQIAARYCATRKKNGKTLLEWADGGDTNMVTRGINGGTHGLADGIAKTEAALSVLQGKRSVAQKQQLLAEAGFNPGPIDGLPGGKTTKATNAAKAETGLNPPELWDKLRKMA